MTTHDQVEPELGCSGELVPRYRKVRGKWMHMNRYKCDACHETLSRIGVQWLHSNAYREKQRREVVL